MKHLPLFDRYKSSYLADVTGYTPDYLKKIRLGLRRVTKEFRAKIVETLVTEGGVTAEDLFGEDNT